MTSPKTWALCLALTILIMLPTQRALAYTEETAGYEIEILKSAETGGETIEISLASDEAEAKATYIGGYEVGKTYRMKTTGYCSCKKCTGTSGASRTASGTWPKAKHTISMSTVPFGTKVKMGGITYTVEDRGGGVKGKHIDVYYSTHSAALKHGLKYMDVVILGKGGSNDKATPKPSQTAAPTPPPSPTLTPTPTASPTPTPTPKPTPTQVLTPPPALTLEPELAIEFTQSPKATPQPEPTDPVEIIEALSILDAPTPELDVPTKETAGDSDFIIGMILNKVFFDIHIECLW